MSHVDPNGEGSEFNVLWARAVELGHQGRFEEAFATGDRLMILAADRDDTDELSLAAASTLRCSLLRLAGREEALLKAAGELDQRYGETADPMTRAVAARPRLDLTWSLMRSGRSREAIGVVDELAGVFGRETDDAALRELAEIFVPAAGQLCWTGLTTDTRAELAARLLVLCVSSITANAYARLRGGRGRHSSGETGAGSLLKRKRVVKLIRRRERLEHAASAFELIRRRLGRADDERARRIVLIASLHRAAVLTMLGHLVRAKTAWDELFAVGESDLGTILNDAKPGSDSSYTGTQLATAWLIYAKDADEVSPTIASIAERIRKHKP